MMDGLSKRLPARVPAGKPLLFLPEGVCMNAKTSARIAVSRKWSREVYRSIIDGAPDGILVAGEDGEIILCNDAAEEMFGFPRQQLLGMSIEDLLPEEERDMHRGFRKQYHRHPRTRPMGTHLDLRGKRSDGKEFPVDIMLSSIDVEGSTVAVAVVRDTTVRERERKEREQLLETLQSAHKEIRTLSGLLPICAWCKNIRDDKGYWSRLEEYFQLHSDLNFTHGICPDCARKFVERNERRSSPSRGRAGKKP